MEAGQSVIDRARDAADKVADAGRKAVHKAEEKARDIKRTIDGQRWTILPRCADTPHARDSAA